MAEGSRGVHRITVFSICVMSLALCCGLAWWQWERFSSANGTFQNLGYVLQWPLFGLFPAFMFWRIRTLRKQQAPTEIEQAEDLHANQAQSTRVTDGDGSGHSVITFAKISGQKSAVTTPPVDSEDDELAAYNRYLAQLNAQN